MNEPNKRINEYRKFAVNWSCSQLVQTFSLFFRSPTNNAQIHKVYITKYILWIEIDMEKNISLYSLDRTNHSFTQFNFMAVASTRAESRWGMTFQHTHTHARTLTRAKNSLNESIKSSQNETASMQKIQAGVKMKIKTIKRNKEILRERASWWKDKDMIHQRQNDMVKKKKTEWSIENDLRVFISDNDDINPRGMLLKSRLSSNKWHIGYGQNRETNGRRRRQSHRKMARNEIERQNYLNVCFNLSTGANGEWKHKTVLCILIYPTKFD